MVDGSRNRNTQRNRRDRYDSAQRRPQRSASSDRRTASQYRSSSRRDTRAQQSLRAESPSRRYSRSQQLARSQQSSRAASTSRRYSSSRNSERGLRFIVIGIVALILIIIVGFAVSRCVGPSAAPVRTTQDVVASATASSEASSAASTSATSSNTAASTTTAALSTESASKASAPQTAVINAKKGDVSYNVAQAARLKHRDADFAVDPNRRDWNYDKPNGRKVIYLTLDDGPSANTERVLEILDQYGCRATFFVTGQNPEYFDWIKKAYDRGHTIGLHSMTHDFAKCYSSPEGFWEEFDAIGQVVKDQIGYVPCFIRFPGGASNTISSEYSQGIMTYLVQDVQNRGYQYYDWEDSCGDGAVHSAAELVESGCHPLESDNVIYLAHDGSAKESTAEALPAIIEYYQAQGYSFEAIDRNTLLYQHGVSN